MVESIVDIDGFLSAKGGLHDCRITDFVWSLKANRLALSILDLNAGFFELPEYLGSQPGCLAFDDVVSVQADVVRLNDNLWIYDVAYALRDGSHAMEFMFTPAGKMIIRFGALSFEPLLEV